MVAVGGGAGVVLVAILGGEGAHVVAGDGVGVKDHMGQPGDGLGHAGVVALDELVDHGDLVLQVHELVQRHGSLGHGVDAAQAGAGVDLDAVSTGAGEDLGGVGLAGGGDGAGQEQVGLGGGLEKQRSVFSQLLLAGVSPEVGYVVGLGHVCGAVLHGDGGGLHGGLHKQPGVGVHGGGGEGQHIVLGGGGVFAHRDFVRGGNESGLVVLVGVLIGTDDLGGTFCHGSHNTRRGNVCDLSVGGGPGHIHGAGGAVGVGRFGDQRAGLAHGQSLRASGVNGQASDGALGNGYVAGSRVVTVIGIYGDRCGSFADGSHDALRRNSSDFILVGFPRHVLVGGIIRRYSGLECIGIFGSQRQGGLVQCDAGNIHVRRCRGQGQAHCQHDGQQEREGAGQGFLHDCTSS